MTNPTTTPAADKFLSRQRNLVLATIRRDGAPQLSPVWFLWERGELIISTITATAKWHNLKRDPRCSACIDDPETGQMVVVSGVARLQDDDVWEKTRALVEKYRAPAEVDPHMERIFAGVHRVLIRLRPDRIITRNLQ